MSARLKILTSMKKLKNGYQKGCSRQAIKGEIIKSYGKEISNHVFNRALKDAIANGLVIPFSSAFRYKLTPKGYKFLAPKPVKMKVKKTTKKKVVKRTTKRKVVKRPTKKNIFNRKRTNKKVLKKKKKTVPKRKVTKRPTKKNIFNRKR